MAIVECVENVDIRSTLKMVAIKTTSIPLLVSRCPRKFDVRTIVQVALTPVYSSLAKSG